RQARQWKGCSERGSPLSLRRPFRIGTKVRALHRGVSLLSWGKFGGPSRNRTGVYGFAVRCVTTPPSGLRRLKCVETAPLAVSFRDCNPIVSQSGLRIPGVGAMRAWRPGAGGLCAPQRAASLYYYCNTASLRLELSRKDLTQG